MAVCVALALASCTAQSDTTSAETVELTFQQFDPAAQVTGLQAAIDEFNASHDRIRVTMSNVAFADALNTFVREAGAGGGPDVLHTAFTWTGDLASNGMILNLEDYIAADAPGAGIDDFLGQEINTYEDSLYAIPFTADSFALTYNIDVLAAAGVAPPEDFDELIEVAATLTSGSGADTTYGLCFPMAGAPGSEIWHLTNVYLWGHGASVVRNDDGDWNPGTTDEQLADTIAYFKSFLDNGYTPENLLSIPLAGDPVVAEGLAQGSCAMTVQTPQQFTVSRESNENLGSAPLPAGPEGRQLQMGGRSLSINTNSEHPDEAWEFIRYITSQEVFEEYYTNQFPAQATLLTEATFGPELSGEPYRGYAESLVEARTYVEYLGAPAPIPAIWNALAEHFNAAFAGQLSVEEAAQQLNSQLEQMLTD